MKTVNLEEIYQKHYDLFFDDLPPYVGSSNQSDFKYGAMREACNQVIDLCVENAQLKVTGDIFDHNFDVEVDKQIIINTKSQII